MSDDELRSAISTWLTVALDGAMPATTLDNDLMALRDWIDGGCTGDMPLPLEVIPPTPEGDLGRMTVESIRVFWETRNWTPAQFRQALVKERLR